MLLLVECVSVDEAAVLARTLDSQQRTPSPTKLDTSKRMATSTIVQRFPEMFSKTVPFSLGMIHDGDNTECPLQSGHLMAPSLKVFDGVASWSECSRRDLDNFLS